MGRTKGSKNLKTLQKEAQESRYTDVAVIDGISVPGNLPRTTQEKMVKQVKTMEALNMPAITVVADKHDEFLIDGAMLKRWLQGVKANYKETKSSDEKYLQLVNEILLYLKRIEEKHATKETSNIEARNNTATVRPD
jgi:hypothetical protein